MTDNESFSGSYLTTYDKKISSSELSPSSFFERQVLYKSSMEELLPSESSEATTSFISAPSLHPLSTSLSENMSTKLSTKKSSAGSSSKKLKAKSEKQTALLDRAGGRETASASRESEACSADILSATILSATRTEDSGNNVKKKRTPKESSGKKNTPVVTCLEIQEVPSAPFTASYKKNVPPRTQPRMAAPFPAVSSEAAMGSLSPKKQTKATSSSTPAIEKPKRPLKGPQQQGFKAQEFIVYPSHGVGQILAIEMQEVAGFNLELFIINFPRDKLTLKVPLAKVTNVGMRKLSDATIIKKALEILATRARVKRTMWSRRAQEYETKINSGDLLALAEVVRDLYRSETQPEQSYSERQLYEAALDRFTREVGAVYDLTDTETAHLIESTLQKSPRRTSKQEMLEDMISSSAEVADLALSPLSSMLEDQALCPEVEASIDEAA